MNISFKGRLSDLITARQDDKKASMQPFTQIQKLKHLQEQSETEMKSISTDVFRHINTQANSLISKAMSIGSQDSSERSHSESLRDITEAGEMHKLVSDAKRFNFLFSPKIPLAVQFNLEDLTRKTIEFKELSLTNIFSIVKSIVAKLSMSDAQMPEQYKLDAINAARILLEEGSPEQKVYTAARLSLEADDIIQMTYNQKVLNDLSSIDKMVDSII